MFALLLITLAAASSASASTCSAHPQGYYSSNAYVAGVPPPSTGGYQYTLQPDFLTCAEMASLNEYCVTRINQYRTGQVAFSNGSFDANFRGAAPVLEAVSNAKCQAEITLGDFVTGNGWCGGARSNAWACSSMRGWKAQNTCCPRNAGSTYASVISALNGCLQHMWDKGMHPAGGTAQCEAMKGTEFKYLSCAFAFAKTSFGANIVYINQNFASSFSGTSVAVPPTTRLPTPLPTTRVPTRLPTRVPTTRVPTLTPTKKPTSRAPTKRPTPTKKPTLAPTKRPTTSKPSKRPTTSKPATFN